MWQEAALGEDRGGRLDWLDLSDRGGPAAQFAIELPIPAVQIGLRPQAERIRSSAMRWDGHGLLLDGRRRWNGLHGVNCECEYECKAQVAGGRCNASALQCSAVQIQ